MSKLRAVAINTGTGGIVVDFQGDIFREIKLLNPGEKRIKKSNQEMFSIKRHTRKKMSVIYNGTNMKH